MSFYSACNGTTRFSDRWYRIVEMEAAFDELEPELRAQAAGQLRGRGADWEFERRQGVIAEELIAVAAGLRDARPGQSVVIMIGSSSHATHRVVGSVAVSLARHSPVPLVIVPEARGAASLGPDPVRTVNVNSPPSRPDGVCRMALETSSAVISSMSSVRGERARMPRTNRRADGTMAGSPGKVTEVSTARLPMRHGEQS